MAPAQARKLLAESNSLTVCKYDKEGGWATAELWDARNEKWETTGDLDLTGERVRPQQHNTY